VTAPAEAPSGQRSDQYDRATLGGFLTEAASRYGRTPALVIKPGVRDRVTTYAALERDASRFARRLQDRGVEKGDRVLIWAPNMPEWVVCFFGCMRAGATLVPLDMRSASDFVATVIRQTQPKLAVLSRTNQRMTDGIGIPTLLIEELERILPPPEQAPNPVAVAPDDLAEIIFTSGTTGDPKGVMLSHRNIVSNVRGADQVLAVSDRFRFLSLLPLSHMFEQNTGLLAPLAGGARIVYPVSRQPSILFRTLAEHRITTLVVVPQVLQILLNGIEREAERKGRTQQLARAFAMAGHLPPALRRVLFRSVHAKMGGALDLAVSGGAALDPALAAKWELLGVSVLQGYGATEAAPIITGDRPGKRRPHAVGTAYPGVEVRVAPDGEVLARGENIFQGYWRNSEATTRALEGGWYHTGDLGELDTDGYLALKGRKKDMIVLANGQNVYPEDIEATLDKQPGVTEAVVVGLPRPEAHVEVHAVLLLREALDTVAAAAVIAANRVLAEHQRIQGWTVWPREDFPRTHTLKVKKHEVLQLLAELAAGKPVQPAQANVTEGASPLLRIVADASGVAANQIRPENALGDDLNLDSLGRVELLSAIEEESGAYVDEAAVSSATTVAELERLIAVAPRTRDGDAYPGWPRHPFVAIVRELALQTFAFSVYRLGYRIRIVGAERIADFKPPALIAVNHNFGRGTLGLDPPAAWLALPFRRRLRTATAGEEHAVFDDPIKGKISYFVNSFPLSKEGNVRGTLEQIGRLLDLGWSVLIFPEGKLTVGGPIQPFMRGTGLIAVEARTPVIPMRIVVERSGFMEGLRYPRRGALTILFGDPLIFPPGTSHAEATDRIETAVRGLYPESAYPQ
jgi:long-chain acyl-CoA synthetase